MEIPSMGLPPPTSQQCSEIAALQDTYDQLVTENNFLADVLFHELPRHVGMVNSTNDLVSDNQALTKELYSTLGPSQVHSLAPLLADVQRTVNEVTQTHLEMADLVLEIGNACQRLGMRQPEVWTDLLGALQSTTGEDIPPATLEGSQRTMPNGMAPFRNGAAISQMPHEMSADLQTDMSYSMSIQQMGLTEEEWQEALLAAGMVPPPQRRRRNKNGSTRAKLRKDKARAAAAAAALAVNEEPPAAAVAA